MVSLHRIFQQRTCEQDLNEFYSDDASNPGSANTEIKFLLQSLHFTGSKCNTFINLSSQSSIYFWIFLEFFLFVIFLFVCFLGFFFLVLFLFLFSHLNDHRALIALLPEAGCSPQSHGIFFPFYCWNSLAAHPKSGDGANLPFPLNTNGMKKEGP